MRTLVGLGALVLVALAITAAAHGARPQRFGSERDAETYVRGWVDGASPAGWAATSVRCTSTPAGWECQAVSTDGTSIECTRGLVAGYGFQGPMYHARCTGSAKGPPA